MEITRTFDLIDLNVEKYPRNDMYAGKLEKEWITWSTDQIREYINHIGYGLLSMGYKKGDKIATISPNKPEWNIADMALAQTGIIHVPIYPTIGTDEYEFILEHSEVKAVIVGNKSIYNKVSPIAGKISNLREIFSFDAVDGLRQFSEIKEEGKMAGQAIKDELENIRESILPDDIVTIIYTSGNYRDIQGCYADPQKSCFKCNHNVKSPSPGIRTQGGELPSPLSCLRKDGQLSLPV